MERMVIGLDVGKNWLHAVAVDANGRTMWRKKLARRERGALFVRLSPALVGMETCGGANYWGRLL